MDILNILNDFIKTNKTEEQLAVEFVNLLNNGQPMYKILRQYDYPLEKVKQIINNAGYKLNEDTQKWEKNNPSSLIDQNDLITDTKTQKNETVDLSIEQDKEIDQYDDPADHLENIVELANNGMDFNTICRKYHISSPKLHKLLLKNGYQHYLFMNYWTKMNRSELCDFLIEQLNQGVTIYDLSGKYTKTNKDRLSFVTKVEQLLNLSKYQFNNKDKKWEKNDVIEKSENPEESVRKSKLDLIIDELNNGVSLKRVSENHRINIRNLRLELKNNNYEYNNDLNKWTKSNINDVSKKNVNIEFNNEEERIDQQQRINKEDIAADESTGLDNYDYDLTDIASIVEAINNGTPLREIAEKMKISDINLKNILKNHQYRFDILFNIWTKEDRKDLVKKLSEDLIQEKVTMNDLKGEKINNLSLLEVELLKYTGYDFNAIKKEINSNHNQSINPIDDKKAFEENQPKQESVRLDKTDFNPEQVNNFELNRPISTNSTNDNKVNQPFNDHEVAALKEIINEWEQKKVEKNDFNDSFQEVSIYIESQVLYKLMKASELEGLSRSKIIEKALIAYFQK